MKKKNKEEIRTKTINELKKEIEEKEAEIVKLSVELKMGKIKDLSLLRKKKDELSVIKTILKEKQLGLEK